MSSSGSGSALEVDANLDDLSDYGSASELSDTTSLSSSIYSYTYENGRRYHSFRDGKYVLPNDETEQDRLDIIHHVCLLFLEGGVTMAPVQEPQRILDVGTGTGIWAMDAADMYPAAEVIGTDLSPIQPSWVPPNCKFEVDDAESDWTFKDNYFDLIHSRHLAQSIKNWPEYLKRCYRHIQPGGYVELFEAEILIRSDDNSIPEDCNLLRWLKIYEESTKAMGIPDPCQKLKQYAIDAGFEDVTERKLKAPWAPWAKDKKLKEIGKYMLLNAESAFEAYGLALLTRFAGMDSDTAKAMCDAAKNDLHNRAVHVYNYQYVIIGRKPFDAPPEPALVAAAQPAQTPEPFQAPPAPQASQAAPSAATAEVPKPS